MSDHYAWGDPDHMSRPARTDIGANARERLYTDVCLAVARRIETLDPDDPASIDAACTAIADDVMRLIGDADGA